MMIVATVTVKPDKIKAFTEAAKEIIEKSNKEAGCKSYQLYQDSYDKQNLFLLKNIRTRLQLMPILQVIISSFCPKNQ